MDMYPYAETLKVGAAYAVLLYVWPCILFRGVLRNKGLTFRFLFCSMVQPLLLSTAVLTLGLFHILNVWIVRALFWGALAVSILRPLWIWQRQSGVRLGMFLRALITRSYGWKLFFLRMEEALEQRWKMSWQRYRKKSVEYLVLAAILLFGMAFFLNGAFHDYSFGCYDEEIHYRWTSALLRGEIFTDGVCQEGMHCFLYALHALFGVRIHSCIVFLAGIHNSSTFLLAAYCLLKVLFRSRHTTLFVLTAWLVFDGIGPAALESVTRMTWMLPQEFALYLVFLCPLVMLRYFREQNKPEKWYHDENLMLLMVGTAFVVSTNTYVLIMALCVCCIMAVVHFREFWPVRRLFALVGAALFGFVLGMLPMFTAYAMGTELEGSLLEGLNVIRGTGGMSVNIADSAAVSYFAQRNLLTGLYEGGYLRLFGEIGSVLLILFSLLASTLAIVYVYAYRRGKLQGGVPPVGMAEGYLTLVAVLTVFVFLYAMPYMGLPRLVDTDRMLCVTQMFVYGVTGILVDLQILWTGHLRGRGLSRRFMVLGCLSLYLLAHLTNFRQCTYWWLQRYNASVTVTEQIMNNYPEWNYRIVSLYDAVYQTDWGSHVQLIDFLESIEEEDYSIPVEYIFLYVEKRPLLRGQVHFLTAPRWLAKDNDYKEFEEDWNRSQCPDILHGEISQELAREAIPYYPGVYDDYDDLTVRTIVCSKVYSWYQEFSSAHPAETNVYYEDDDFVCYVIHQVQASPLNLAVGRGGGE